MYVFDGKRLPITRIEETPSKGLRYVYFTDAPVETVSAFHNLCALELLGTRKLCIMSLSVGYRNLNDNTPTVVQDLEGMFYEALHAVGVKGEKRSVIWFDREDLTGRSYRGKHPPCLETLLRGTQEGPRNEHGIRIASYLLNFRKWQPKTALKVDRSMQVPEEENFVIPSASGVATSIHWDKPLSRQRAHVIIKTITGKNPHYLRAMTETHYGRIFRTNWALKSFMGLSDLRSTEPYVKIDWRDYADKMLE